MTIGQIRAGAWAGALLLGASGASAAPAADQNPARPTEVRPFTAVAAVTEADEDMTNCSRSRRRLWVDGEGWIVRRVTTCR